MPYVKQDRRWGALSDLTKLTSGDLNYRITLLIRAYLKIKGTNYTTMNDIIGALDSAKEEFRRRIMNPYEDKKKKENGDVYDT